VGDYLQTQEEQRIHSLKDQILNILQAEITAVTNIHVDLDRIAKRVDYIDPHHDILNFIQNNQSKIVSNYNQTIKIFNRYRH
jgi:hypothetical protein